MKKKKKSFINKMMNYGAVLTGDIVKSSKIHSADIDTLLNSLKESFREINSARLDGKGFIEFYRGDSFQIVMEHIEFALLVSILIRAHLRSFEPSVMNKKIGEKIKKPLLNTFSDARISIGVGEIKYSQGSILQWQGEAFQRSGKFFDEKLTGNKRLWINTPWKSGNKELEVEISLLDALIEKWTNTTSRTMYRYLLYKEKQSDLASYFKISQPSVSRRLVKYGDSDVIELLLKRYQTLIWENDEYD